MFQRAVHARQSALQPRKIHVYVRGGVCHAGKGFGKKNVENVSDEDEAVRSGSRDALSTSTSGVRVRDENARSTPVQTLASGVTSSSSSSVNEVTGNRRSRRRRTPTGMKVLDLREREREMKSMLR